jgi:hypothetical protein
MAWKPPPYRKPDYNILFAVNYVDGRSAYIALSPKKVASGDHVVPTIARELQEKGEIPPGEIKGVKRVR